MPFTAAYQTYIFNWAFRNTAAPASVATVYLGLSTADPLDDASGNAEPAGFAYARQAIAFDAPASVNGVGTSGPNSANIVFPTATGGAWGLITHGTLWDALTLGNMIAYVQWAIAQNIADGNTFAVAAADLVPLIR